MCFQTLLDTRNLNPNDKVNQTDSRTRENIQTDQFTTFFKKNQQQKLCQKERAKQMLESTAVSIIYIYTANSRRFFFIFSK